MRMRTVRPRKPGFNVETREYLGQGLDRKEMCANSNLFMIAGTETTATFLSGLTYYLLTNSEKLARLIGEIRRAFVTESEITLESLQSLSYPRGCLEEGLQMYPPVSMACHGLCQATARQLPGDMFWKR